MSEQRALYITYDGALEPIAQSQVLNYIRRLAKDGFKFYLVSFEKKENLRDEAYLSRMAEGMARNGIVWLRLKYHARPKVLATFFDIILGGIFCFFVVLKNRIGIIHVRAEMPATMALPALLIPGIRFIYDRRGVMAYDYVEGGLWPKNRAMTKFLCRSINALDRVFLNRADHVVVLSRKMKDFLGENFFKSKKNDKVRVIPCCVDVDKFVPARPDASGDRGSFTLVYSGSLGTWNMLNEMVDFFSELKRHKNNAHFSIVTQSPVRMVEDTVGGRLKREDYTVRSGRYEEMPGYIAEADAGIIFRIPGFAKTAASPTKFGEYLACGVPVVINSGIGDTEELVRGGRIGVIVDRFCEDDYRSAALELLKMHAEGKFLRQRCRDAGVKEFSLAGGVEKYLEIYRSLR
ncbi:MAG: glycosyltransferase [Candidatus Omnitrophica bacterium]|nr:glycosyltransferase [Candidatus Omnitrophota bacterium]